MWFLNFLIIIGKNSWFLWMLSFTEWKNSWVDLWLRLGFRFRARLWSLRINLLQFDIYFFQFWLEIDDRWYFGVDAISPLLLWEVRRTLHFLLHRCPWDRTRTVVACVKILRSMVRSVPLLAIVIAKCAFGPSLGRWTDWAWRYQVLGDLDRHLNLFIQTQFLDRSALILLLWNLRTSSLECTIRWPGSIQFLLHQLLNLPLQVDLGCLLVQVSSICKLDP